MGPSLPFTDNFGLIFMTPVLLLLLYPLLKILDGISTERLRKKVSKMTYEDFFVRKIVDPINFSIYRKRLLELSEGKSSVEIESDMSKAKSFKEVFEDVYKIKRKKELKDEDLDTLLQTKVKKTYEKEVYESFIAEKLVEISIDVLMAYMTSQAFYSYDGLFYDEYKKRVRLKLAKMPLKVLIQLADKPGSYEDEFLDNDLISNMIADEIEEKLPKASESEVDDLQDIVTNMFVLRMLQDELYDRNDSSSHDDWSFGGSSFTGSSGSFGGGFSGGGGSSGGGGAGRSF